MNITDEILEQIKKEQPLWSNWYIKEEIGSGAFSKVYRAEAHRNDRTDISAVKIEPIMVEGNVFTDEQQKISLLNKKKKMAENEASVMYRLRDCPNIVRYEDETSKAIYADGKLEGYYFLIRMEYLSNVYQMISRHQFDFSEKNIRRLASDIACGLKSAHDIGVIHRDVKPANFFVSDNGTYKLGDFNISKQTVSTRSFAGADGYIAPEIYLSKVNANNSYTKQVDIYSLGICLYQMMNGGLFPFEKECDGNTEDAIDKRMRNECPLPPPIKASRKFAKIILRACEFDPNSRYMTIDEFIEDLNHLPPITDLNDPSYADETIYAAPDISNNVPVFQNTVIQEKKSRKSIVVLIIVIILIIILGAEAFAMYTMKNADGSDDMMSVSEANHEEEAEENDTDTPEMQSEIITEPPTEEPTEPPTIKEPARNIGNFKKVVSNISASSTFEDETVGSILYSYSAWNIIDNDLSTCWIESNENDGTGESIKIDFDDVYSINEINIWNGYCKDADFYYWNCRIHECTIILSDGTAIASELADGWENQRNTIQLPEGTETSSVEIIIQSVYLGNGCTDTCISEITVS